MHGTQQGKTGLQVAMFRVRMAPMGQHSFPTIPSTTTVPLPDRKFELHQLGQRNPQISGVSLAAMPHTKATGHCSPTLRNLRLACDMPLVAATSLVPTSAYLKRPPALLTYVQHATGYATWMIEIAES